MWFTFSLQALRYKQALKEAHDNSLSKKPRDKNETEAFFSVSYILIPTVKFNVVDASSPRRGRVRKIPTAQPSGRIDQHQGATSLSACVDIWTNNNVHTQCKHISFIHSSNKEYESATSLSACMKKQFIHLIHFQLAAMLTIVPNGFYITLENFRIIF